MLKQSLNASCMPSNPRHITNLLINKVNIASWVGRSTPITAEVVYDIRDWTAFFKEMGIRPEGGMLGESKGLHCFLFMRRRDLPVSLQGKVTIAGTAACRRDTVPNDLDIVGLVKRYVSDTELCQTPVLVLPFGRLDRLPSRVPNAIAPRKTPKHGDTWLQLAQHMLQRYGDDASKETARYLIDLACEHRSQGSLPELPWHSRYIEPSALPNPEAPNLAKQVVGPAAFRVVLR